MKTKVLSYEGYTFVVHTASDMVGISIYHEATLVGSAHGGPAEAMAQAMKKAVAIVNNHKEK